MKHTITITKRADDYHAHIDGDKRLWGCGRTPREAVGSVVWTHGDRLGIDIEDQGGGELAQPPRPETRGAA